MRSLDGNQKALLLLPLTIFRLFIESKSFEIVMGHVRVLAVTRVIANLLLLLLKSSDERLQLALGFFQLVLLQVNRVVSLSQLWCHKVDWIGQLLKCPTHPFLGTAAEVICLVQASWPLASVDCAWAIPADVVLALLGDEADAFKHVRNVIDSSLLHLE